MERIGFLVNHPRSGATVSEVGCRDHEIGRRSPRVRLIPIPKRFGTVEDNSAEWREAIEFPAYPLMCRILSRQVGRKLEYCPKDGTQSLNEIDSMHTGVDGLPRQASKRRKARCSRQLNQGLGAGKGPRFSDVEPGNEGTF